MKTSGRVLMGVAALTAASLAQADVTLKLSGSSAFRFATISAIENLYGGNFACAIQSTSTATPAADAEKSASQSIFRGPVAGLGTVTIKCMWAGSVGGLQSAILNVVPPLIVQPHPWMADANLPPVPASGSTIVFSDPNTVGYDPDSGADVAMSDVFLKTTPLGTAGNSDYVVGVVPFRWVANAGSPLTISNATPGLVKATLAGGQVLALWTGNSADNNKGIYFMGRNADSGTRGATFTESGFGFNGAPLQFRDLSSTAGAVTTFGAYPQETILGKVYPAGQSGDNSGGTLVTRMKLTSNGPMTNPDGFAGYGDDGSGNISAYFVAYMGRGDANNLLNANPPGHALSWNGVADTDENIQTGRYTFWSYEHLVYKTSVVTGDKLTYATKLRTRIHDFDADLPVNGVKIGLKISSMQVERPGDGAPIVYGNTLYP